VYESGSEPVVVVGAGLSGLAAAAELAPIRPVTLVERLPAAGGTWEFDHPAVIDLVEACQQRGVSWLLGASALRWTDGRLLVVGPGQASRLSAAHLVFAGGRRPATAAELRIAGGRLAGVFAETVAHHLLEAGVVLGRQTVVVGDADLSTSILAHLARHGDVSVVGASIPSPTTTDPAARVAHSTPVPLPKGVRSWPGFRVLTITGTDRVSTVRIGDGRVEFDLACDCVILAGPTRPWRNVDGAVGDDSPGVTFVQPDGAGLDADEFISTARRLTQRVPRPGAAAPGSPRSQ